MNEEKNPEQPARAEVTPPPFQPTQVQTDQSPAAPTVEDRIAALGLADGDAARLRELTAGLDGNALSTDLLATLARGVTHDDDVQNADAAGYLRGRNEKIEAVLHPEPDEPDQCETAPVFPRYCRRSIWDD